MMRWASRSACRLSNRVASSVAGANPPVSFTAAGIAVAPQSRARNLASRYRKSRMIKPVGFGGTLKSGESPEMAEAEHDNGAPSLTLRMADIDVQGPDGVFAEDCMQRQPAVELLCSVLATTESPAVVALNGQFGSGKSTFLKMCAAVLRQEEITVVEIDAWQQRYTGDALVDLIGALSDTLPTEQERLRKVLDFAGRIARGAAWGTVSHLTGGVLGAPESNEAHRSPIADWHAFKEARDGLRGAISKIAVDHGGRIIFLIDELDRCPPPYALDVLDRVRNVLDIRGVVVLYGITRSQLVNAVHQEQSAGSDAGAYLARFFDREIQLRPPSRFESLQFIQRQTARLPNLAALSQPQVAGPLGQLQHYAVGLMGGRLRDIQQFLCAADTVLWLTQHGEDRVVALVLLTLRHVARGTYDEFIAGNINGYEAAAALNVPAARIAGDPADLTPWLQAHLILRSLGERAALPDVEQFVDKYTAAEAGTEKEAAVAHSALLDRYNNANNISTVTASLPHLVSLVEMSEPPA